MAHPVQQASPPARALRNLCCVGWGVVVQRGAAVQVDMALPEAELRRRFPLFPGAAAAVEVELQAGEMLYLPASWFHEVTSASAAAAEPHAAVNYWFHPPDALGAAAGHFPYSTDFWGDAWNARVGRCGWDAVLAVPLRGDDSAPRVGKRKHGARGCAW